MYRRPLLVAAVLLLPLVGILQGCAPPGSNTEKQFQVNGKVVRGGNPLPLDPAQAAAKAAFVRLEFVRDKGDAKNSAFANPDGTFSVKLPKGKYGIQIVHMGAGGDQLQGKFNNQNDRKGGKAKIEKEVSGDVADMVIELDDYK